MKRTVIGILLLLVLLAGGIASTAGMSRHNEKVAALLDGAADRAMAGDLAGAIQETEQAWTSWKRGWNVSAAFSSHEPLEEIDGGFAQLRIYGEAEQTIAFAAVCVQLAKQVRAVGDAHGVQWWNIL